MTTVSTAASGAQRAAMANDPAAGAGTWFGLLCAQERDHATPLVWLDEPWRGPHGDVVESFSVEQLAELVRALAATYHGLGVCPRDPVGVYSATGIEYYVNHLALISLGAIPVLVNGALPVDIAVAYMLRVGVVGVFADEAKAALLTAADPDGALGFVRTSAHGLAPEQGLPALYPYQHDASDPVLITHSSGTTGVPKAVPMHHDNFFAGIRLRLRLAVPKVMERVLCALPPAHNSAITNFTFSLLAGLPIRLMSTQDAEAVLRAIEDFRPTMVSGFSTTFAELCQLDLDAHDLESVQLWWNSGDAAHERHIRRLQRYGTHYKVGRDGVTVEPGSAFTDALGSSEMGHSLFNSLRQPGAPIIPRCFGLPLDFVDAAVLDQDGRKLPVGEVGLLGIKSPTLTKGYWNDSLKTARARLAGYWLTGDLVAQDEQGRFYHYDRVTDAISTAEGTLYSVQAEELILRHVPEIADCTVIGVEASGAADGVQTAHVYLQPDRGVDLEAFDAVDWTARINELLAAHGLVAVGSATRLDKEHLVLGPTGKVKKRELRERFAAAAAGGDRAGA